MSKFGLAFPAEARESGFAAGADPFLESVSATGSSAGRLSVSVSDSSRAVVGIRISAPLQKDLAHDQFASQQRHIIALDPEVLRFQQRVIDRRILDRHVLKMKTGPWGKADAKNGYRITEIFADNFPQSQLSAGDWT